MGAKAQEWQTGLSITIDAGWEKQNDKKQTNKKKSQWGGFHMSPLYILHSAVRSKPAWAKSIGRVRTFNITWHKTIGVICHYIRDPASSIKTLEQIQSKHIGDSKLRPVNPDRSCSDDVFGMFYQSECNDFQMCLVSSPGKKKKKKQQTPVKLFGVSYSLTHAGCDRELIKLSFSSSDTRKHLHGAHAARDDSCEQLK